MVLIYLAHQRSQIISSARGVPTQEKSARIFRMSIRDPAEREFWLNTSKDCFDADARAKGVDRYKHLVVMDAGDRARAELTVDGLALSREQMREIGARLGAQVARHPDEIFARLLGMDKTATF